MSAMMDDPTGYGRVIRDARGHVFDVVEQKAGTPEQLAIREANMGIYCFRADLFWKHVDEIQPNNPAREYYLTDMPEILTRPATPWRPCRSTTPPKRSASTTARNSPRSMRIFRDRKRSAVMAAGVTLIKPETITIDAAVEIGMDTIVEPFAQILGKTTIGENCRIGACSIIQDSALADDVEIGAFTVVGTSVLERGAHVGPYARLRMENHVEAGAHIGNFVELKKTRMGAGAKANHLAYLGDSDIGARGQYRRGHHHLQLRWLQEAPHADRRGRLCRQQLDPGRADRDRRGRLRGGGIGDHRGRPADALALGRARQEISPNGRRNGAGWPRP